jgi:hypothetical protein
MDVHVALALADEPGHFHRFLACALNVHNAGVSVHVALSGLNGSLTGHA